MVCQIWKLRGLSITHNDMFASGLRQRYIALPHVALLQLRCLLNTGDSTGVYTLEPGFDTELFTDIFGPMREESLAWRFYPTVNSDSEEP